MSEIHDSQSIHSNINKLSEDTPIREDPIIEESLSAGVAGPVTGSEKPSNDSIAKPIEDLDVEGSHRNTINSVKPKPPRPITSSINGSIAASSEDKPQTAVRERKSIANSKDSRTHTADGLGMSHHITHRS